MFDHCISITLCKERGKVLGKPSTILKVSTHIMDGPIDAVIGDAVLRNIVGSNLFRSIRTGNLPNHIILLEFLDGYLIVSLVLLFLDNPSLFFPSKTFTEDLDGTSLVHLLTPLLLDGNLETGWKVGHPDGTVGLVDVLASRATRLERVDAEVAIRDDRERGLFDALRFGLYLEKGNRGGARVDAALGIGLWDPLYPVYANLIAKL